MKALSFGLFIVFLVGCVSKSKHEDLQERHDQAQEKLTKSQSEVEKLEAQVADLETVIANLEKKLGDASSDRKSLKLSIEQMKKALNEASERKQQAEDRIQEFKSLISKFRSLIDSGDLSVKIVDGRMVVALPSDVLFASGSATLSEEGQKAIQEVSQLLTSIEDKKYQVEGHTDNVPISTERFPSNWELSAARATNVVKEMVEAGLPEPRISAAAFADTRPVAQNNTEKGRKSNRRIEIVIVPDLSNLPGYEELKSYTEEES